MEIVIKMPDELYDEITLDEACGLNELTRIIAKGTPLPKGHGDLIDRKELEKCKETIYTTLGGGGICAVWMCDIKDMSPIITADKENE